MVPLQESFQSFWEIGVDVKAESQIQERRRVTLMQPLAPLQKG